MTLVSYYETGVYYLIVQNKKKIYIEHIIRVSPIEKKIVQAVTWSYLVGLIKKWYYIEYN